MRRLWIATLLVVVGCAASAGFPTRPDLPDCAPDQQVYLPARQGPDEFEAQSNEALDCFMTGVEDSEPAELEFILLGVEGQEYRSLLQSLDDGTVNFIRKTDRGQETHLGCSDFSVPEPGIPEVGNCDSVEGDRSE